MATTILTTNLNMLGAQETPAYQLAVLHTKSEEPNKKLSNKSIEPSRAVLAEFEWIMQSLQNRCLDSPPSIANTIVETWYVTQRKGGNLSLLEVARALLQMAQNTNLFGLNKVSFRVTSRYWLAKHFLSGKK